MKRLVCATIVVTSSLCSFAGQPTAIRLEWLVRNSDFIAVGTVVSADARQKRPCTNSEINYVIEKSEDLKGRLERMEFCADQRLFAGGTYVFFASVQSYMSVISPQSIQIQAALLVTESFLDATSRWIEIDPVAGVSPGDITIRQEKVSKCIEDGKPVPCEIVRARALIRFSDLVKVIQHSPTESQ